MEESDDIGTKGWINNFDPKIALRDLKIQMIINEVSFTILPIHIEKNKKELDFIKSVCPNDVITGSFALSLYGLIYRSYNDIDILIKDKDRYPKSHYNNNHSYSGDINSENRLGHKIHNYRKEITINNKFLNSLLLPFLSTINLFTTLYRYKVDYFIDTDVKFNTFDYKGHTYKIHCPIQIIDQKLDLSIKEYKHYNDLYTIFKNIYNIQSKNGDISLL